MNHRPIDPPGVTTAQLRVRQPLVNREEPPDEVRLTSPRNNGWLTRAVGSFVQRFRGTKNGTPDPSRVRKGG